MKPIRNPLCNICKQLATRWSGGEMHTLVKENDKVITKSLGILYRCVDCDPRHKWFDLVEEDY